MLSGNFLITEESEQKTYGFFFFFLFHHHCIDENAHNMKVDDLARRKMQLAFGVFQGQLLEIGP